MAARRSRDQWHWPVLLALAIATIPGTAAAHERWFTPYGPYWTPEWGRLASLPVLIGLLAATAMVALLTVGERLTGDPLWPRPRFLQRLEPAAPAILGVQTAITLIFAASRLNLFVPNIALPHNAVGVVVAGLALVTAFTFVTGVLTRWGAVLLIGLWGLAFVFGAPYEAAEQIVFVGIGLYMLGVGRGQELYAPLPGESEPAWLAPIRRHALTLLRIGAALSVIVLAFTEKLLAPGLGVAFLQEYPHFNVARDLGFTWFTDERFVFAAGIVELTAGVALLSGRLIRVVILLLWLPFNLGIPFLPAEELIGHLPILAAMYVLLVRGTAGIPPQDGSAAAMTVDANQPTTPSEQLA